MIDCNKFGRRDWCCCAQCRVDPPDTKTVAADQQVHAAEVEVQTIGVAAEVEVQTIKVALAVIFREVTQQEYTAAAHR